MPQQAVESLPDQVSDGSHNPVATMIRTVTMVVWSELETAVEADPQSPQLQRRS